MLANTTLSTGLETTKILQRSRKFQNIQVKKSKGPVCQICGTPCESATPDDQLNETIKTKECINVYGPNTRKALQLRHQENRDQSALRCAMFVYPRSHGRSLLECLICFPLLHPTPQFAPRKAKNVSSVCMYMYILSCTFCPNTLVQTSEKLWLHWPIKFVV